jgi:hypothetical protein
MLRVLSTGVRSSFSPGTVESSRSRYSACLTHCDRSHRSPAAIFFRSQPGCHHFFPPHLHRPSQRIGVRTRIQPGGLNQIPAPGQDPRALRAAHVLAAADADEIHAEACQPADVVPRRQHVGRVDHQRDARAAGDLAGTAPARQGFPISSRRSCRQGSTSSPSDRPSHRSAPAPTRRRRSGRRCCEPRDRSRCDGPSG